jgi:transcriptional antiterminator RfaH
LAASLHLSDRVSHENSSIQVRSRFWAVVNTHPHREHVACENLTRQEFEIYCPLVRKLRRHARQTTSVLRPLFPGYVFLRVDPDRTRWRPILSTIGVRTVVRFGDRLGSLADEFIDAIRAREENGVIVRPEVLRPTMPYTIGQQVRLNGGAFDGVIATILALEDNERLVVLMDLLRRGVQVKVTMDQVMPLHPEKMQKSIKAGPSPH